MAKVHLLPPDVVRRIAAGEVVERPASILKEVIENSIDAGADSLVIDLEGAGRRSIRVQDNGSGVDREDMEQLFYRHSTSKISSFEDLESLSTLGFRGEALYSIAAVSEVFFRSRVSESSEGWELHIRGGERLGLKPCAMAKGTVIEVKQVFFNTPARKKFLKSDASEMRACLDVFLSQAIASFGIAFSFSAGRTVYTLPSGEGFRERVAHLLNLPLEHLFEAEAEIPEHRAFVRIVAGDQNLQRPRRENQFIVVSGRPVINKAISFAVNRAYESLLPAQRYGCFAVFLDIPPEEIDANIHPSKQEVKIAGEREIASFVASFLLATLSSRGAAKQYRLDPKIARELSESTEKKRPFERKKSAIPMKSRESVTPYVSPTAQSKVLFPHISPVRDRFSSLREALASSSFLGSFRAKYLLFEATAALFIMDQHAAHERITFETLKRQMKEGTVPVQQLLMPLVFSLSPQERVAWEERKQAIEAVGFSASLWEQDSIAVHSHPQSLLFPEYAVRALLAEEPISYTDKEALARRACRQSLMAGTVLLREEAEALKTSLLDCEEPFTCPHGRPTVIELDEQSIARQFLRSG
ncbi:MAG: DNA mismatch repair endonuclease MutL [Candidatus Ratteibacteria bacterium]|jgi:DNA mismatch repair protein MutL